MVLSGSTPTGRIDFTSPITKFGGYWAAAFNGDINLTFFDASNTIISTDTITYTLSGPLEWFGWMTSTVTDPAIAAVEWTGYFATLDGIQTNAIPVPASSLVPVPPSVWLFGSGLIGLIGIARRKSI